MLLKEKPDVYASWCYKCVTVCAGAVTSVCRYFSVVSQRAHISKSLSLKSPPHKHIHLLGETCYFSLSGLEKVLTSYTHR